MAGGVVPTIDHGIEGWDRAVEVYGEHADRLRVGHMLRVSHGRVKIVGLAKRRKPQREDGVVVLVRLA